MSLTVRITTGTHSALRGLSRATGRSMQDLLTQAIDEFRRKWILTASAKAFRNLRRDRKAWKDMAKEGALWECTLSDGLDPR